MRAFVNACDVFLAATRARDAIYIERKKRVGAICDSMMQQKAWRWTSVHQPSPLGYGPGRYVWRLRRRVRTPEEAVKALNFPFNPLDIARSYKRIQQNDLTKIISLCCELPNGSVVSITPEDFNLFKDFYWDSSR